MKKLLIVLLTSFVLGRQQSISLSINRQSNRRHTGEHSDTVKKSKSNIFY
jgi:hypothetical protein